MGKLSVFHHNFANQVYRNDQNIFNASLMVFILVLRHYCNTPPIQNPWMFILYHKKRHPFGCL